MNYFDKYLKYKKKYNNIKYMNGGNILDDLLKSDDLNFDASVLNSYKDYKKNNLDQLDNLNDLYDKHLDLDKSKNNIYVILFKANWCGHCNNFLPTWNQLQQSHEDDDNIKYITYEHTNEEHLQIINSLKIGGFPTILIYKNNNYIQYNQSRDFETLRNFINS